MPRLSCPVWHGPPICPTAPPGAGPGATATPQRSPPTGGDRGYTTPAHPALRDVAGPPSARPVRGGRRLPVSAAQRAISHAGGSCGARVGLCLPYPRALAGTARTMADTRSPERPHALPTLCQRAPGGHGRHPSGSHTVVESGTDRKPDQSPEDAEAPDVWPGTPRSAGPTLPIGGMTSA